MAETQPTDPFTMLLALLTLGSNTDDARKAIAGAKLAAMGSRFAGAPGALSSGLGGAAGAAGLGLNLADVFGRDDLSTMDKVGEGFGSGFDAIGSFTIPYYGQAKLVGAIGGALAKSSSPQVEALGRTVNAVAEPGAAKMFEAGIRGHGPWEYMDQKAASEEFILDLLGPLGSVARGLGKGGKVAEGITKYGPIPFGDKLLGFFQHKPTSGTQFRESMEKAFRRIPGFETFQKTDENYNMTAEQLAKYDQRDVKAAEHLAKMIAPFGAEYDTASAAYAEQLRNMLLNMYGHPGELQSKFAPAIAWLTKQYPTPS